MSLSGLAQINLELTSKCDKTHFCAFCGHQNETINPSLTYGDMDYDLLQHIRSQLEPGVVIAFHRDGEPTAYPRLGEALRLFDGFTTSLVTHGLSLGRKADAIIGAVTTVTVSVFRGDPDAGHQLESLAAFIRQIGESVIPQVQVKVVGDMSEAELQPYCDLGVRVIRRIIHEPDGNKKYAHRPPTIPEVGVCLDALHHPSIDWNGRVYLCNRLDPTGSTFLGSLLDARLDGIWNGERRMAWIEAHKVGRRDLASPLCKDCTFWGIASEWQPSPMAALIKVDTCV